MSSIVTPVSGVGGWRGLRGLGGVLWGGSFVKSGMKWTFDVRFVAGLERDIQPAFSWLGPSTALREAPLTDNMFM